MHHLVYLPSCLEMYLNISRSDGSLRFRAPELASSHLVKVLNSICESDGIRTYIDGRSEFGAFAQKFGIGSSRASDRYSRIARVEDVLALLLGFIPKRLKYGDQLVAYRGSPLVATTAFIARYNLLAIPFVDDRWNREWENINIFLNSPESVGATFSRFVLRNLDGQETARLAHPINYDWTCVTGNDVLQAFDILFADDIRCEEFCRELSH